LTTIVCKVFFYLWRLIAVSSNCVLKSLITAGFSRKTVYNLKVKLPELADFYN